MGLLLLAVAAVGLLRVVASGLLLRVSSPVLRVVATLRRVVRLLTVLAGLLLLLATWLLLSAGDKSLTRHEGGERSGVGVETSRHSDGGWKERDGEGREGVKRD